MTGISGAAIRWLEETTAQSVIESRLLPGGRSGSVYRCWLNNGSSVVVRHEQAAEDQALVDAAVGRETAALRQLDAGTIPVPSVVASDVSCGLLATTHLPGRMLMGAGDLRPRINAIADLAVEIASQELASDHGLPEWRSWVPPHPVAPAWGDAELWNEAIDAYTERETPAASASVLVHRDLHPGNVLWNGQKVSGVVDWVNACVGHPHAELGHCRWNLTCLVDSDAAEEFLRRYLRWSDSGAYDPWWDLSCALSFLPGPIDPGGWVDGGRLDLTTDMVVERTEDFMKRALST